MTPARRPGASTFRARLTVGMALLSLAVLAVAGAAIYVWARNALVGTFDGALLTIAQIEVASAIDEPDGAIHIHEGVPIPLGGAGAGATRR
jgi:hypothetical protein